MGVSLKDNEALVKWARQTQQVSARVQCWEKACTLTPQELLSVLTQMEAKGATGQWPSIPAAEAQGHTYENLSVSKPVEILCGNLHSHTMSAPTFRIDQSMIYSVIQLAGIKLF